MSFSRDCQWEFRLPDVQTVIGLRCDAFDVGQAEIGHRRVKSSDVSELSSARLSSDLARARDLSARLSSARAIFEPARV